MIALLITFTGLMELWTQKMGFSGNKPSKAIVKNKKIPIGLAVRIDLLKNCSHASAWSRYVGPQKSEATL